MIDVTWYDMSHHIILWKIADTFTLEDFNIASQRTTDMVASVPLHTGVYTIVDVRHVKEVPSGIISAIIAKNHRSDSKENYRMTLIIGVDSIVHSIINVVMRLPGVSRRFMFMETMQDAIDYIAEKESGGHATNGK